MITKLYIHFLLYMWDSKINFDSGLQSYVLLKDGHIDAVQLKSKHVRSYSYIVVSMLCTTIYCVTLIVVLDV